MKSFLYIFLLLTLVACGRKEQEPDAYGNFIAEEMIISAENSGKILARNIDEGDRVVAGQVAYVIDSVQTHFKRMELRAQQKIVTAKRSGIQAQINVLHEQERAVKTDLERFRNLLPQGAVSKKQVDDLENNLSVIRKQIEQVETNFLTVSAEADAVNASLGQAEDMLRRTRIIVPVDGTILETYAEKGESVNQGKALFKIASLDTMELKAYFSASSLADIRLGDSIEVLTDSGDDNFRKYRGFVSWIAAESEFTPKIIQTREERVNLVYAVKISVANDGFIKINMPGEARIIRNAAQQ